MVLGSVGAGGLSSSDVASQCWVLHGEKERSGWRTRKPKAKRSTVEFQKHLAVKFKAHSSGNLNKEHSNTSIFRKGILIWRIFFFNCAIVVVTRWLLGVPSLWWWCLGRVPDVRVARPGRSRRWQCSVVFTPAVSPLLPYFKTLITFNALSYCFRAWCFFGANISTLEMFAAGQVQTFWVHNLLQAKTMLCILLNSLFHSYIFLS